MARKASSQELWTEAEALERAGKPGEAVALFVKAALAEEDAGELLRARVLWERIAERTGATGTLLERLALCSARAKRREDAFDFWLAAAARFHAEGRVEEAGRARSRASDLKAAGRLAPHERTGLAAKALADGDAYVRDLLEP